MNIGLTNNLTNMVGVSLPGIPGIPSFPTIGTNSSNFDLVDPFFSGAFDWVKKQLSGLFEYIISFAFDGFEPTSAFFYEQLGITDGTGSMNTFFDVFLIAGLVMALFIFVFSLITLSLGAATDQKNSYLELLGRFFLLSIPGVWLSRPLLNNFNDVTQKIIDSMNGVSLVGSANPADGILQSTAQSISQTLFCLIYIILYIAIVIEFVKLLLEIIERYLVVQIMNMASPVVFSFLASRTTNSILFSFFRMYLAQLFLLVMNRFFLLGFGKILFSGTTKDITMCLFIIAYLKCAQRIDSYMKSMGLSVAQTGGSLLDTAMLAAGTLKSMVSLGRKGVAGAAGMMEVAGGQSGNYGLSSAGTMLKSLATKGISTPATPADSLSSFARNGGNITGKAADGKMRAAMVNAFNNGNYREVSSMSGQIQTDAIKSILSQKNAAGKDLLEAATGYSASNIKAATIDNYGGISGRVERINSAGNMEAFNFKMSGNNNNARAMITGISDGTDRGISTTSVSTIDSGFSMDYVHADEAGLSNFSSLTGIDTDDNRLSGVGVTRMDYDGSNWIGYNADNEIAYKYDTTTRNSIYSGMESTYDLDSFQNEFVEGGRFYKLCGGETPVECTTNGKDFYAEFNGSQKDSEHSDGYSIRILSPESATFEKKGNVKIIDMGKKDGQYELHRDYKKSSN